ncbi:MAG: ribbon-helix-helix domain-containing protein [Candidatus Thermoplasmatota archaeon]|nr:ribbon-helix-helix domain-containing protein [Candidatus Thermoplasmatota archaeon]
MTQDDKQEPEKAGSESGIEYRATIRFPRKDYEFMQGLIEEGEYTNITEIVRDAVKRFRLEWRDMEAARNFQPMGPMMGMRMMPRMKQMMRRMQQQEQQEE